MNEIEVFLVALINELFDIKKHICNGNIHEGAVELGILIGTVKNRQISEEISRLKQGERGWLDQNERGWSDPNERDQLHEEVRLRGTSIREKTDLIKRQETNIVQLESVIKKIRKNHVLDDRLNEVIDYLLKNSCCPGFLSDKTEMA